MQSDLLSIERTHRHSKRVMSGDDQNWVQHCLHVTYIRAVALDREAALVHAADQHILFIRR